MEYTSVNESVDKLEEIIGYRFKNRNIVIQALTHSSYANERKSRNLQSNERLEFLGDAVLSIAVSEKLFCEFTELAEGQMTKTRAIIVCEASLIKCSDKIGMGRFLLLGKGEEITGGRTRTSILADAFEALIAAIYLDGGMESAKSFIYRQMYEIIEDALKGITFRDYKTQLQEIVQKNTESTITYEIIGEKGPDHNKQFVSLVQINGKTAGKGQGRSKKEAEQNAARQALDQINELENSNE